MKEIITIPKTLGKENGPEYQWLKDNGLKYIEKLASRIWTDYNTHDPGITILELLCWVITDLGYRVSLPVEDIVASEENNLQQMHKQFLSALNILPSAPVTADDYRRLFIRVDGVKNAWMQKAKQSVMAAFKPQPVKMRYAGEAETPKDGEEFLFDLNGLYNILLDIEETHIEKKDDIFRQIKQVYHHFRNLGEDLAEVKSVDKQEIVICADVELEAKADPEETWARIIYAIEEYLSPPVNFYSLQQMQDKGKTSEEIFDGPAFDFTSLQNSITTDTATLFTKKGFVDNEEIKKSGLRTEVRLSDIIRIVQQIQGVKLIRSIAFGFCGCDEKDSEKINKAVDKNNWLLCIKPGHKPVLCLTNSVINFHKNVIPLELKQLEANLKFAELKNEAITKQQATEVEDLPMPLGKYRDIQTYNSLQNHFPETYGIGLIGLPESATAERKAMARQLKAYLLFFDQVLANYFSQLAHVKDLLSTESDLKKTYFSNVVKKLRDSENIFIGSGNWEASIDKIMQTAKLDNYIERKNKFLDHLLARFAEQFNEYVFLLHRIYGKNYDEAIIRQKKDFYKDYTNMSMYRADGLDYYNKKNTEEKKYNVSGMEKRLSRLLGFNHYKRDKKFSSPSYFIFKIDPTDNFSPYSWTIDIEGTIVLKGTGTTLKKADAYEEMGLAALLGCERQNYETILSADKKKVSFRIFSADKNNIEIVAFSSGEFEVDDGEVDSGKFAKAEAAITKLIDYFLSDFRLEGMYVVEHILLRPPYDKNNLSSGSFMPVCIDVNGNYCRPLDPYSFRIAVILPGYTMRMRNKEFRRYAEWLIRLETPAHILPRICFINEAQMNEFETVYNLWLDERNKLADPSEQHPVYTSLIDVLEKLFTVYNEGTLGDCDDDTEEINPMILGQTNLGTL